ncbi:uncharacterized protein LOC116067087 [Sander lucioperca]|uniref:uncharacterized protein LOC116067087 n=1 Tax=Sander lucioperca TaxID=283035 RepID=UPI0016538431|nr:uncharacterized protein LOC116067087 [Sander lucioperca]
MYRTDTHHHNGYIDYAYNRGGGEEATSQGHNNTGCNSDPIVVTVPGDDVILLCPAPYPSIRAVEWIRADLEPDNVFLYRDGHLNTTNQHPSFKDRVELVDRDLKDGDVSLTLKNVSRHDNGTYECRLIIGGYDPFITMITIRLQITDLIVVTVHPGDDVILPCQADGSPISFAEWTRPDLEPEYVLLYRDERLDTDYQNPSFKDRVELVDRDLKDRDVSLILKNVRSIDAGTYRCGVIIGDTDPMRTIRTISIIRLQVTDLIEVPVHPGDDVILPCQAADSSIRAVEWTRPDLEPPEYVLYYSDGHLDPTYQHPSFEDRVELVDRDLKDGDVSLTLKNVSRHDAGIYECRVASGGFRRKKRSVINSEPIRILRLQVPDPAGSNSGHSEDINSSPGGSYVGLTAAVLVLVAAAVVGVLMYKRHQIVVTVHPGDDVTLSCQAAGSSISVVKWSRPDLEPDTVFFYIDGHLETDVQNPSFKDRVELVDRDLKDGDASLILKNVSRHDTGTYTCGVKTDDSRRKKRDTNSDLIRPIRTVRLQVPERGSEDVNSSPGGRDGGLVAGVLVVLVLVAAAVGGVLMYRRRQKKRPGPPAASPDLTVTVYPGDDVILPCQAAGSSIRTLKWTREDLDPDTVLLYRDGRLELDHQHPSFEDRVELVDRDLKDGDVSLILKNVSRHDTGTYECRVKTGDTDLIRTIRTVRLQVPDLFDPGVS